MRAWEMERDFLAAHVVSWVGELAQEIRARTEHPWFLGLAELLVAFTRHDLATLEKVLGPSARKPLPEYAPIGVA
jgi:TorA maturation chaperone TorD